jgi:hypothetical protein
MDMMRSTRKSYQKFSFQKSFPISILSAAMFFSLNAQAADAPATVTSPAAPTTTITTTKTVPAAPSSPAATNAASNPANAATPAASTTTAPAAKKAVATDDSGGTIAQVIWVKGTVKATQGAQPARVLARRSPIYQHDVLTTDNSGTGEVAFTDSSVLTLRESTELRVDEYEFKKDPSGGGAGKEVMSLVKGGFRTITGAIPKANPESYQVNTPVATIGVRGTDYAAYYSKQEGLMAKIFDGRITVKNDQGLVELSKELSHLYALIRIGEAPVILQKEPAAFQSQPAPTPVTKSTINGIGTPGGPGGSKTVSSFCVGLVKDFTKSINDFFS